MRSSFFFFEWRVSPRTRALAARPAAAHVRRHFRPALRPTRRLSLTQLSERRETSHRRNKFGSEIKHSFPLQHAFCQSFGGSTTAHGIPGDRAPRCQRGARRTRAIDQTPFFRDDGHAGPTHSARSALACRLRLVITLNATRIRTLIAHLRYVYIKFACRALSRSVGTGTGDARMYVDFL